MASVNVTSSGGVANSLGLENCGLTVPTGSAIDGFSFGVKGTASPNDSGLFVGANVGLDGGATGTDQSAGGTTFLPNSTLGWVTFGGPTNLCGLSPTDCTAAAVNGPGFGPSFLWQGVSGLGGAFGIDAMFITVHFTPPSGPPSQASFLLASF